MASLLSIETSKYKTHNHGELLQILQRSPIKIKIHQNPSRSKQKLKKIRIKNEHNKKKKIQTGNFGVGINSEQSGKAQNSVWSVLRVGSVDLAAAALILVIFSYACAISMNRFSASAFFSGSRCRSGCHSRDSLRYLFVIS